MPEHTLSLEQINHFQQFILNYYQAHGRHDLPWRQNHDPYRIMVSEIMLQQTQVERVIDKFNAFMTAFPTVQDLAQSSLADVLKQWQGLGYNRRGKYLHLAAKSIVEKFDGNMPLETKDMLSLPGIGTYTAAAIQAFAFNQPVYIIETNIRTVFIYHFFPDDEKVEDAALEPLIRQTIDVINPRRWYSALMDYGSYLKSIHPNPTRKSSGYVKQSTFIGSRRQVRGEVLKALTLHDQLTHQELLDTIAGDTSKLDEVLTHLQNEEFITLHAPYYRLNHG
jgi:A/G-specific adenine glycosylase